MANKIAKHDPAHYREMSAPFESDQAFREAVNGFFEELGELRAKYHLADVYIVIMDAVAGQGDSITALSYGDSTKSIHMTAWAFGHEQERHRAFLAKLMGA